MLLTNLSSQFLSVHLQDSSHHYHKDERIKCYMSPEKVFWNGWQIYRLSLKPEKFQIRHLSSLRRLRVTGFITAKASLPFGEPSHHHPRARPRGHPLSRFWVWGWALDVPFTESQNQLSWRKPLTLSWGMITPHVNCKTSDIIMGYDWTPHVNYNMALSTSSVLHPVCPSIPSETVTPLGSPFQYPITPSVKKILLDVQPKSPLVLLKTMSSHLVTDYLGQETDPDLQLPFREL